MNSFGLGQKTGFDESDPANYYAGQIGESVVKEVFQYVLSYYKN